VNAFLFFEIELEREVGRRAALVDVVLVLEDYDADPRPVPDARAAAVEPGPET
jgi:hypothetical protein